MNTSTADSRDQIPSSETAFSTSQKNRIVAILPLLFLLSGASSLIFETIFTRLLTYTFGNTAYAVSTVLASFLGGLALGAFVLGRWLVRRGRRLLIFLGCWTVSCQLVHTLYWTVCSGVGVS